VKMGEIIRRLRIERELTQEKLAGMLGITSQAVSKWERDEGLPDITLLPAIAAALDCSTDELLGVKRGLSEEELHGILKKAQEIIFGDESVEELQNPNPDAGVDYLREEVKKHPSEWRIHQALASFLGLSMGFSGKDERKFREQLEHYEYVRQHAPDIRSRLTGVVGLVQAYSDVGEYEKAEEAAEELAIPFQTYRSQVPRFLRGDRLREVLRDELIGTMLKLRDTVYQLTSGVYDTNTKKLDKSHTGTLEQQLGLVELAVKVLEVMYNSGWGSDWGVFTAMELWHGAQLALEHGQPELALDYIERSVEYCRPVPGEKAVYVFHPDLEKKDPNYKEPGIPSVRIRGNVISMIDSAENDPTFIFANLIDHPRWKALREELMSMGE